MPRPHCQPITFRFQKTPTSDPGTDDMIHIYPAINTGLYVVRYYEADTVVTRQFTLTKSDVFKYLSTVFRSQWTDDEPCSGIQVQLPGAPSNLFHARMDSATRDLIYDGVEMTMRSWPLRLDVVSAQ